MKNYVRVNQIVYDDLAKEYQQKMQEYIISDKKITAPFINYLKNHFDKIRVLELGPGSGLNLSYFENEGFDTTAIDISKEILRVSKEMAPKTNYLHEDFLEFNFSNLKFEGIFAKAFIHLFPKKDAVIALRKIFHLLEEDGIAFIATTIHENSDEGFFEKSDYNKKMKRFRKKWTETELLEEVKKVGFVVFDKSYVNVPMPKTTHFSVWMRHIEHPKIEHHSNRTF